MPIGIAAQQGPHTRHSAPIVPSPRDRFDNARQLHEREVLVESRSQNLGPALVENYLAHVGPSFLAPWLLQTRRAFASIRFSEPRATLF